MDPARARARAKNAPRGAERRSLALPARHELSRLVALAVARYDLLMAFVRREVGVRYKEAYAGAAWAVLQPLAFAGVFTLLFAYTAKVPGTGPLVAYVALVPWIFAATSITQGSQSLLNHLAVVSKIYFPRSVLPLAAIVAAGLDAAVAFGLQLVLLLAFGVGLEPTLLLWPLLMILTAGVCVGISLLLAPAILRFRDLRYVIPFGLQLLLLASPVGYPLAAVPEHLRGWYELNPFVGLMEGFRAISLQGEVPSLATLAPAAAWGVALILVGGLYFRAREATVADYA